jgi:hypothetical protein
MIRVQVLEGSWQILGRDILPGVEPREVLPSWGPSGPESLGFTLYRSPSRVHAELRPFTPIEWYPGDRADGPPLWSGYTMQAPPGGDSGVTSVTCQGWHFYREEVPGTALYVHDDLTEWVDGRSLPTADLSARTTAWQIESGSGAVVLSLPAAATAASGTSCSVILDCGPSNTARRVVLTYASGDPSSGWHLLLRSATTPFGTDENFTLATDLAAGPTTVAQTFSAGRRYVEVLFSNQTGGTGTGTGATWVRLNSVKVFAETAYESGNASIFTADMGIKQARTTLCPLLSSDESRIASVAFAIRHSAWLREDSTARDRMDAWNAYHGYRLGVDAEKRVFFQAQPSMPRLQVDASDFGVDYVATSTNDGSEVYNHVSVRGKSGSGEELRLNRLLADVYTVGDMPLSGIALTNADFDAGVTTGWTGPGLSAVAGGAHSGGFLLQMSTPSVAAGAFTGAGSFLRGRFYRLTGYFKVAATTTTTVTVGLGATTDNRQQALALQNTTGAAAWMPWSVVWQPQADYATGSVFAYAGEVAGGQWDTFAVADATASNGILGPRLRVRSFTLNVSAATDLVAMAALAQAFLLAHRSVPHKANLTIAGDAVTDLTAGRQVPASELGRYYGEMIRVLSVPDPDTGALTSRDGVIASVQGSGPASLALDSERRSLEALMARMGVVQGTA